MPKCGGQQGRGVLTDVADAERVDEARQRHGARARRWRRGASPPTAARSPRGVSSWSTVTREEVGGVGDEAGVDELVDDRLAEALDVHPRARGEMAQTLAALGRAQRVDAAAHHLVGLAHQLAVAGGAAVGHHPRPGALGPLLEQRAHDLRDHVARLVEQHRVADAHVLARHLVLVVQGAAAHRRARPRTPGRRWATGVTAPVRPTCTAMSRTSVSTSSGGNL